MRYEIRAAGVSDEEQLLRLSRFLNTVNLPHDRQHVRRLLDHASQSFSGEIKERHRKYVFVLWDRTGPRGSHVADRAQLADATPLTSTWRSVPKEVLDLWQTLPPHCAAARVLLRWCDRDRGWSWIRRDGRQRTPRASDLLRALSVHRASPRIVRNEILAELLPPLEPDGTSPVGGARSSFQPTELRPTPTSSRARTRLHP